MGLFESLFGSSLESRLEQQIVPVFRSMGESPGQAKASFAKMLNDVKDEAAKDGTLNAPENGGDTLLQKEKTDEATRAALAKLRSEGVTDQDVRSWWNQSDLERRIALKLDELPRGALYISCRRKGATPDEAAAEIWKIHAMYGDPNDTSLRKGDDRPLPVELRRRINDCIQKNWMSRPQQLKASLDEFTSFNAWIRSQMKSGAV